MVRPKIQLERLNGRTARQHYYLNNKPIISKKVKELSVLTTADVLLLGFSPVGIPTLHLGENSDFMNVVKKFAEVSETEREKRRHDNIQTMKANYQKEDGYNIEVEKIFDAWKVRKMEELQQELDQLKKDLFEVRQKRRFYQNPELVNDMDTLKEMEATLKQSLEMIRKHKEDKRLEQQKADAERLIESTIGPFEEYLPDMLSGNDERLAGTNELLSKNEASTSQDQQK